MQLEGRHTGNRNPAGARVTVTSQGRTRSGNVSQRDNGGIVADTVGTWCLGGPTDVVLDSSVNTGSDSVSRVILIPR